MNPQAQALAGLLAIVVLGSIIAVLVDAAGRDWSRWRDPQHPERMPLGDGVGTWLIVLVVLWPVALPGYLIDRRYAPKNDEGPAAGRGYGA